MNDVCVSFYCVFVCCVDECGCVFHVDVAPTVQRKLLVGWQLVNWETVEVS